MKNSGRSALLAFVLQLCLVGLKGHEDSLPAELTKRLKEANLDGSCVKPIPITSDIYEELKKGPFPGDECGDGIPCRIPYKLWYCGMCGGIWPYCLRTPFGNNTFCTWCQEEGCMASSVPSNTSEDYPDYFDYADYNLGPFQDPK